MRDVRQSSKQRDLLGYQYAECTESSQQPDSLGY